MQTPRLIYFADPMCSWCYGFSPVISQIRQTFGRALPIQLVMGGLRPGNDKPTTEQAKTELKIHWEHVHEATGLPFDEAVLDRPGFLYDTDPAARPEREDRRISPVCSGRQHDPGHGAEKFTPRIAAGSSSQASPPRRDRSARREV